MKEIRKNARELMKGACRVCARCDGRACTGEVPGMGGLGTGRSFQNNIQALDELTLNMRLIHAASQPSPATTWLGLDLAFPVMAAPIGGMFNFNDAITESEYIQAVLGGSKDAGTIGSTGDGVPPIITDSAFEAISSLGGHGIPFIKPWENEELDEKLERAMATGCTIVGMDVDAAGLVTLRKMGRPVGPKTQAQLNAVINKVHQAGCKFVVKGIMTVADALAAAEAGADSLVVSNHGGRVLDATPGTATVLPGIAKALDSRIPIMVDGGVRTGGDILKMLALGAHMVGIGRPVTIAAIGGGREGVASYLNGLKGELIQAMVLTGCATIASISKEVLYR